MSDLKNKTYNVIRKYLLRQKSEVEKNLKAVEKDDPLKTDSLAETSEPGTDSWMAEMHGRAQSLGTGLRQMLQKTQQALENLRKGKYGKCESCGKQIELDRLKAMPTATLCISCSKKKK